VISYWKQVGQVKGEFKSSHPSRDTMKYFINTQLWRSRRKIDIFYFSFDGILEVIAEGSWSFYWGIWDEN
jgi:hypothetical protein